MGKKKIFTSDAWENFIAGITMLKTNINNKADKNHTHIKSEITDLPNIPTKLSELVNDSGFKTVDTNTTYTISKNGKIVTLTGSDGSTSEYIEENVFYITVTPDDNADGMMGMAVGIIDKSVEEIAEAFYGGKILICQVSYDGAMIYLPLLLSTGSGSVDNTALIFGAYALDAFVIVVISAEYVLIQSISMPTMDDIPTATSQLNNDSGFITNSVSNLTNYYNKTNVDNKDADVLADAKAYTDTISEYALTVVKGLDTAVLDAAKGYTDTSVAGKADSNHDHDDVYYTQGQIDSKLSNKSSTDHTHNYAGSSSAGGAATSANKLNTDDGTTAQPVYFKNGVPVKITHTLEKSVPSNAVFTDTTYTIGEGTVDGAISVKASTANSATNVKVRGLGSAAYTDSTAYDASGAADEALTTAKSYTDSKVSGVASTSNVTTAISNHDTSSTAHDDIRKVLSEVKEDVDSFFKDATISTEAKDTLKEIQDYITSDVEAAANMTASINSKASGTHTHTAAYTPAGTVGSRSITPAGSVTSSFTGTEAFHNHTFTGTAASHGHTFTGEEQTISVDYTPAGSISSTSITPAGSVTSSFSGTAASHNHGFTGTKATISASYTPAGSVTSSFTGSAVNTGAPSGTTPSTTVASSTHTHEYTPSGSVSQPTFTGTEGSTTSISGTTTVYSITGIGSLPSHTYTAPSLTASCTNRCLTLTFSAGSHSFSAGSLPTQGSGVSVATGTHTHKYTPAGSVSKPTFTGTKASTSSISGTTSVASTSHIHSVTAAGSVSSSFTGTGATISTEYTPAGTVANTSITPAGSVSSSFKGTAASHDHGFTGTAATLETDYTPVGTVSNTSVTPTGTIGDKGLTPAGSVSSSFKGTAASHDHGFTGTAATITTDSPK